MMLLVACFFIFGGFGLAVGTLIADHRHVNRDCGRWCLEIYYKSKYSPQMITLANEIEQEVRAMLDQDLVCPAGY